MDIRGIEVTNQLRSAIRAKLLELGVRYDEELPDYILVMVVNKKTRQQMHEDLHLFLEESTTPFVEWLHDQVLKKLQKVTIAKKKTSREFVPTIVVKQEEERKKRKNIAANEDKTENVQKLLQVPTKEEKTQKIIEKSSNSLENEKINEIPMNTQENSFATIHETEKISSSREIEPTTESSTTKPKNLEIISKNVDIVTKNSDTISESKTSESRSKLISKRPLDALEVITERPEKRIKSIEKKVDNFKDQKGVEEENEDNKEEEEEEEEEENVGEKRLKSCVNKPKIISVVSVKKRLGVVSPRKKFEIHRGRDTKNSRYEKIAFDSLNRRNQRPKSFEDNFSRRNDARNRPPPRANETRSVVRRDEKFRNTEKNDKLERNVKERLGLNKKISNDETTTRNSKNTIKDRLGPMRNNFGPSGNFSMVREREKSRLEEDETTNNEDPDRDDDASIVDVGPVKSRIIAVRKPEAMNNRNRNIGKILNEDIEKDNDDDDETESGKMIASKVIVTPRPLKPLQPNQKRATQSLLLRAVAEANQSVVKQKNPEPVLTDKIPKLKRLRQSGTREIGKNLSVHLNATKRLVMEKIQVQLSTTDNEGDKKDREYASHPVNDEHMGVVLSLFQRSDDNQKFLVTLNGYNNNVIKEKSLSEEEEERLDMEVTEDDELVLSNLPNETCDPNDSSPTPSQIIESEQENEPSEKIIINDENNENCNIENVEAIEESPARKRRKLSPIVYTRSRSESPDGVTSKLPIASLKETLEKKTILEISNTTEKSRDKCRYWPNCTLGTKCAYYHPAVPCSVFPACKFGDKCAYKHPKCKFGLACTKLGCSFSHPKQQCKYHPFCTKPTCPYSHPPTHVVVPADSTRAKFTWKRREI